MQFSRIRLCSLQSRPRNYWKSIENQREFILNLAEKLGVKNSPEKWPKMMSRKVVAEHKGAGLHNKYKGMKDLLETLFPEHSFDFSYKSRGYWMDEQNQRSFLDEYMKKNGMTSLDDWYDVNVMDFRKSGGRGLLERYKNFFTMLTTLYPNHSWNIEKRKQRPHGFWKNEENRKEYILNRVKELDIDVHNREDWSKTETSQLFPPGSGALSNYYQSPKDAVEECFPDIGGISLKTRPKDYWKDIQNQRQFFNDLGKKLNIENVDDWNQVSSSTIMEHRGWWIFNEYRTVIEALSAVYPEVEWEESRRTRYPRFYWNSKENVENFLKKITEHLKIEHSDDWYRVSSIQIRALGGGGLLIKYKSLYNLLTEFYPEIDWDESRLKMRDKRSAQRWLFLQVKELFPNEEVIEDFIYSEKERTSGIAIEYDIYIPKLKLALEYHGYHHYHDIPSFGSLELYKTRDKEKINLSKEQGVSLAVIPYSWDGTLTTLKNMIQTQITDNNILEIIQMNENIIKKE